MNKNCLTYALNLWSKNNKLEILYDGNHVIAVEDGLIFDYDFRQRGDESRYLPLQKCHEKETIKRIFNLNEKNCKIIDEYFGHVKNN